MEVMAQPPVTEGGGEIPVEVCDLAKGLGAEFTASSGAVQLSQTGRMRQSPAAAWMKFRAKQSIALNRCGFDWRASSGPAGLIHVRDKLAHDAGDLTVSVLGIAPIAHVRGSPEANRGELFRYLAELALAPDAIVSNRSLRWRVLSARKLSVEAGEGVGAALVEFTLNEDGRIGEIYAAARPRAIAKSFVPTPWRGRFSDYRSHAGRWLPFAAEVAWLIDGREFVCWQGRIETWSIRTGA